MGNIYKPKKPSDQLGELFTAYKTLLSKSNLRITSGNLIGARQICTDERRDRTGRETTVKDIANNKSLIAFNQ